MDPSGHPTLRKEAPPIRAPPSVRRPSFPHAGSGSLAVILLFASLRLAGCSPDAGSADDRSLPSAERDAGTVDLPAVGLEEQRARAPSSEPGVRAQPGKRALIVAVGEYAPSSGWEPISSENDVPLIRAALESHGFGSIATLTGPVATREGILEAARRELLEPAGPGDVVVFHYSGHGHQITDNDGDEIDGYDEVLVPYDAPAEPPSDYDGSRHVRDDDLGNLVQELRRRVGPSGNVIVVLDACHSGSATRGRARTRGPRPGVGPIGPPAETARDEAERGGGGFADPPPPGMTSPRTSSSPRPGPTSTRRKRRTRRGTWSDP
jgi:hypothetical protein